MIGLYRSGENANVYGIDVKNESLDPLGNEITANYFISLNNLSADPQAMALFYNENKSIVTVVYKSDKSVKYCFTPLKVLDQSVSLCTKNT